MSGLYPEAAGVLLNTTDIGKSRPGTPSMPGLFRAAGYWTAAAGKVFHRPLDNPGGNARSETEAFDNDEIASALTGF